MAYPLLLKPLPPLRRGYGRVRGVRSALWAFLMFSVLFTFLFSGRGGKGRVGLGIGERNPPGHVRPPKQPKHPMHKVPVWQRQTPALNSSRKEVLKLHPTNDRDTNHTDFDWPRARWGEWYTSITQFIGSNAHVLLKIALAAVALTFGILIISCLHTFFRNCYAEIKRQREMKYPDHGRIGGGGGGKERDRRGGAYGCTCAWSFGLGCSSCKCDGCDACNASPTNYGLSRKKVDRYDTRQTPRTTYSSVSIDEEVMSPSGRGVVEIYVRS
ncbi:hypothetical protein AAMO2058_000827100 [Amorphochlora amoebiformis]